MELWAQAFHPSETSNIRVTFNSRYKFLDTKALEESEPKNYMVNWHPN